MTEKTSNSYKVNGLMNRPRLNACHCFEFKQICYNEKLRKGLAKETFLGCYFVARKKPIGREKTKPQAPAVISFGFLTCSHILSFAVNGHETINIPEIFQVVRHRQ